MRTETFSYDHVNGWSVPAFPRAAGPNTLVIVFGAARYLDEPGPLATLIASYPGAHVIGCSTAGEMAGRRVLDDTLSVAVTSFDRTTLRIARAPVADRASSAAAAASLGRGLAGPDLRAVFVLSDGISVNGSELLRGLHSVVPSSVVVTGGLAGDGSRFQRTWTLADGPPQEGAIVAVGFYGDAIRIAHGSRGGWDIFGPEREVTRSLGSVLFELDGQPALDLYKKYLGERAADLPASALLFPLALRSGARPDTTLVRTVLSVDTEARSMTFAGDIPQGDRVQLMRANFDRLIEGASEAGRRAASSAEGETLSVAISCVGRRLVLGERTEEEVEATRDALSSQTRLLGFYSYGEISPFAVGEPSDLHNQTMTVSSFWED